MSPAVNSEKKWGKILFVFLLLLMDLIFLYYVKYKNQNIPLNNFSIFNIGNALNLAFTLLLLIGLLTYSFQKKNLVKPFLVVTFSVVMTLLLIAAVLTNTVKLNLPEYYIYDQPLTKIITGGLFFSFQFVQFMLISVLWLSLLRRKEFLALRAAIDSAVLAVIILLFAFLFLTLKIEQFKKNKLIDKKADITVGIVLGAAVWSGNKPGPSLTARTEKASELLKKNLIDKILFTGGNAPGELSEAEVGYNYLINKNIEPSKIIIEKTTTSTSEQILYVKKNFTDKNDEISIVIISDSYHLPRVNEICTFYDIKASTVSSGLQLSLQSNIYYRIRESLALLVFWLFAL